MFWARHTRKPVEGLVIGAYGPALDDAIPVPVRDTPTSGVLCPVRLSRTPRQYP